MSSGGGTIARKGYTSIQARIIKICSKFDSIMSDNGMSINSTDEEAVVSNNANDII